MLRDAAAGFAVGILCALAAWGAWSMMMLNWPSLMACVAP